ncbi:hypothetical protein A6R68_17524, partial [Neotoma lepida]
MYRSSSRQRILQCPTLFFQHFGRDQPAAGNTKCRKACWVIKGHCRKYCKSGEQLRRDETTRQLSNSVPPNAKTVSVEAPSPLLTNSLSNYRAYGGEKKCLAEWGKCRKNCKDGEMMRDMCKNHRICCIRDTRAGKRKTSVRWTTEETTTLESDPVKDAINGHTREC